MIKIIHKGKKPASRMRFTCVWCRSVLEADRSDLTEDGFYRNEQYYTFNCPVCGESRSIVENDMQEVEDECR